MRQWKLYIDDTGAVSAGTYSEVAAAVSANNASTWKTIVAPVCDSTTYETEEPEVIQVAINAQIKCKKGDAIDNRLHAAKKAGSMQGVMVASGDVNGAGAAGGGHKVLEMNALVKTFNVTQQAGSYLVYDVVFVPHDSNTVSTLPNEYISTDN